MFQEAYVLMVLEMACGDSSVSRTGGIGGRGGPGDTPPLTIVADPPAVALPALA